MDIQSRPPKKHAILVDRGDNPCDTHIHTVVVSIVCERVECDWAVIRMLSSVSVGKPSFSYVTFRFSVLTIGTFVVETGFSSESEWYLTLSVWTVGGWKDDNRSSYSRPISDQEYSVCCTPKNTTRSLKCSWLNDYSQENDYILITE